MAHHALHRTVPIALGALLLAGCGSQIASTTAAAPAAAATSPAATAVAASPAPSTVSATPSTRSSAPAATGSYIGYATYSANKAAYSAGKVVLFFHAPWCPSCRVTKENLLADPSAIPAGLTIVKIDYDTSTDLKATYGVTVQHTFVEVGADGAMLAKWSGTLTASDIAGRLV